MLVDTNVLSELGRRSPQPQVARWAESVALPISISVITLEEILFGLSWRPSPRIAEWYERFLEENCNVLPVTEPIASRAGRLRGQLRRMGRQRTQADLLIAATALTHELTLVTRNTRDFDGLGLDLLDPFEGP